MSESHSQLMTRWLTDGWMNASSDNIGAYFTEDFEGIDPQLPDVVVGQAGALHFIKSLQEAFGDQEIRIDGMVEEEDKIATKLTVRARHCSDYLGCAVTGEQVTFSVMCWWEIRDGRFHRLWQLMDTRAIANQIGNADSPAAMAGTVPDSGMLPEPGPETGAEERNKETVRQWMQGAWNEGKLNLVQDLIAENMWFWDASSPVVSSRKDFVQWAGSIDHAFSERRLDIDDLIAQGDRTAYRLTLNATHSGDFMGHAATGRPVRATALVMAVHKDGQFAKGWQHLDVATILNQVGR